MLTGTPPLHYFSPSSRTIGMEQARMQTKPVVSRAKAYLKVRHKNVRDAMKHLKLDGMLLTHPPDLAYLTNFTGDDSIGLLTAKDLQIVTDFRYEEQTQLEAGWVKVVIRDAKMEDALAKAIAGALKGSGSAGAHRIGFEANFATVGQIDALMTALKTAKLNVELVPLENVMANIRKVKDDHEVDLIRKSVAVAEEAYEALLSEIKPGLTENYLAGLMVLELRSRGASNSSFPVIVAAAANSSLPHYRPGE